MTLDLSSNVDEVLKKPRRTQSQPGPSKDNTERAVSEDPKLGPKEQDDPSPSSSEPQSTIRIIDSHCRNPLVLYQGQLYDCHWASTLGTDLTLAHADVTLPFEPLHRADGFQIVSKGTIRLMGTPAKLVPKKGINVDMLPLPSFTTNPSTSSAVIDPELIQPSGSTIPAPISAVTVEDASASAPHSDISPEGRRKQAAFLQRITAAKRARGDTDEIPVLSNGSYAEIVAAQAQAGPRAQKTRASWAGRRADQLTTQGKSGPSKEVQGLETHSDAMQLDLDEDGSIQRHGNI